MSFTADGLRPLLVVTATRGRRETKPRFIRDGSTPIDWAFRFMPYNDCDQRPPAGLHCAPRAQNFLALSARIAPPATVRCIA